MVSEVWYNGGYKVKSHAAIMALQTTDMQWRHKTIFINTDHKKVPQLPIDLYGAQQSQVCPTKNEVGLHLNKVEEI